jgi:hypothetical protein
MTVTAAPHTDPHMIDFVAQALSNPIIPAVGLAVAATVGALWLAAAWWAYRDAARRTGTPFAGLLAAAWIVVSSPFLLPLALAVYGLARPQQTAAEKRSTRLVVELVDQLEADGERCPSCRLDVDPTWLRCPSCATWLAQPCASCGGWSDRNLEICPLCGSEDRAAPAVDPLEPASVEPLQPVPVMDAPRKRRGRGSRRAAQEAQQDLRLPRRLSAMADAPSAVTARAR